jgi:hypothetical protein
MERDDEFMADARQAMGVSIFEKEPELWELAVEAGQLWFLLRSRDVVAYQAELFRTSGRVRPFKGVALSAEALQLAGQLAPREVCAGSRNLTSSALRERFGTEPGMSKLVGLDAWHYVNAAITTARQRAIGITDYRWRCLQTRGDCGHAGREGMKFSWVAPPPEGHPGQPVGCTCYASAELPGLDDLAAKIRHGEGLVPSVPGDARILDQGSAGSSVAKFLRNLPALISRAASALVRRRWRR